MIKHRHHRLLTFITEHSFTTHRSFKQSYYNQFSSGSKVVLKHHTPSLITCQLHGQPNKSTTKDKGGDHAHDLFIVRTRMMIVSTVAVINDIICNKGK